jgi:VanZ family protein
VKKAYVYLAVTILIMIVIFVFSGQDATQSGELSSEVLVWIETTILDGPKADTAEIGTFLVRKAAHLSIYLCLGASCALTVREFRPKGHPFRWAWLIAAVYAATDEFHQYFVPGRSSEFRDVCIDALGALVGVVIVWFVQRQKAKKYEKYKCRL